MKYFKSVIGIALSNIIGFGTSFIIGIILPVFLSVSDYGNYREFILYVNFAYVFNLGFNEGIYIKYGGLETLGINHKEVQEEKGFITYFHFLILIIIVILALIFNNLKIFYFGLAVFFINLSNYHQNFLQATGEFSFFSRANILKSIVYILLLLINLFVFNNYNYQTYVILFIISYILLYFIYEYRSKKVYGNSLKFNPRRKFSLFKVGFFILIANVAMTFVGNIGNWVINLWYNIEEFAQYSFQNSLLNLLLLLVSAIGLVFYNLISKNDNVKLIISIKKICIFIGLISGIGFFVFKYAIIYFIPDYIPSISMLSITFIAIPYIMISNIVTANLYKVQRSEIKYFKDSIIYASLSFMFVLIIHLLFRDMRFIALATTFCYIIWYIYSITIEFNILKSDFKEVVLLSSHSLIFYLSANFIGNIYGLVVYLIYLIIVMIAYRDDIKSIIETIKLM